MGRPIQRIECNYQPTSYAGSTTLKAFQIMVSAPSWSSTEAIIQTKKSNTKEEASSMEKICDYSQMTNSNGHMQILTVRITSDNPRSSTKRSYVENTRLTLVPVIGSVGTGLIWAHLVEAIGNLLSLHKGMYREHLRNRDYPNSGSKMKQQWLRLQYDVGRSNWNNRATQQGGWEPQIWSLNLNDRTLTFWERRYGN